VLRHHTHVLHLMGEGAWEVHDAAAYRFDGAAEQAGDGVTVPLPQALDKPLAGSAAAPLYRSLVTH